MSGWLYRPSLLVFFVLVIGANSNCHFLLKEFGGPSRHLSLAYLLSYYFFLSQYTIHIHIQLGVGTKKVEVKDYYLV